MSNTIPIPQPDAYEYLIADVWRTQTHWNGVKASAYRCLYATEKVHAHAAAVSAAKDARIKVLEDALRKAIVQNEHDMLMTGEELRAARAALGDKT